MTRPQRRLNALVECEYCAGRGYRQHETVLGREERCPECGGRGKVHVRQLRRKKASNG